MEFSDVVSVEQTVDSASVHGVVSSIAPIKVSQRRGEYFNETLSDGKVTTKLVGFRLGLAGQNKTDVIVADLTCSWCTNVYTKTTESERQLNCTIST